MSCVFEANGVTLWNPSNTVARLFKAEAEAVADAFHVRGCTAWMRRTRPTSGR